jgi:hypothetical protein
MHVLIRQRILSHSSARSKGLYLNLLVGLMGPASNKPGQIPEYSPPLERVSPLLALLVFCYFFFWQKKNGQELDTNV